MVADQNTTTTLARSMNSTDSLKLQQMEDRRTGIISSNPGSRQPSIVIPSTNISNTTDGLPFGVSNVSPIRNELQTHVGNYDEMKE
jgi:hypothetical protein